MTQINHIFPKLLKSILNSYSQVFFSNNYLFALILLFVSFFDIYAGISGLLSVIISNVLAYLIGFNRDNIKSGFYGFNSLMVGLGIGIFYQPGPEFFLLVLSASVLTLFLTVMLEGVIGKYGLPFLSIPFLLGIWMVTLAAREFTVLSISERGIYALNEMYALGGINMVKAYNWFTESNIPSSLVIYFRSLGAIFFQYHLLAGIFIAIGILIYSRIAFLLSLIGFYAAYLFYHIVGVDINTLSFSYIGFNYILTAIAVGGFFIIPSKYSYLWVILLTPLVAIAMTSMNALFSIFQLSIYSLPFNFVVLLFIYILKFRERFYRKPELVSVQQFSPEKNLYAHLNHKIRFNPDFPMIFSLPFWGEWKVTQGHNGEITHKEEWKQAWDFEIFDEEGHNYDKNGHSREDYWCYDKPIIAPADGWIEEIIDGIKENDIGDINLKNNWGNTVIIKHTEKLFTKISHIREGSFKVKKGDWVKQGDLLATCGNSGRSPVPHIHFQVQQDPFVGAGTIEYPMGHYILHKENFFMLKSHDFPEKGEQISNIEKNDSLSGAFRFVPGQKLVFEVEDSKNVQHNTITWEIETDIYKNTYLYCRNTNSKAYFRNENELFYFTHFQGNKKSYLFYFYLGAYKIIKGFYKDLKIEDHYPLNIFPNPVLIFLQDMVAPFFRFMQSEFSLEYLQMKENFIDSAIEMSANTKVLAGKKVLKSIDFRIFVENREIEKFDITDGTRQITLRCKKG